jgi:hypothetical protein
MSAPWPTAAACRLHPVGHRLAVLVGDEREVGQVVVEQEALDHQVRTDAASTEVVMARAWPLSSTALRCEVENAQWRAVGRQGQVRALRLPGQARFMLCSPPLGALAR